MTCLVLIMALVNISTELLQERLLVGQLAAQDLITFAQITSPLPSDYLNVRKTRYKAAAHHHFIADRLMAFAERNGRKNSMISIPYRHGKTEISVRKYVPWLAGRWPHKSGIVITHTDKLAHDLGRDCRDVFTGTGYRLAFPKKEAQLREGSAAMNRLQTNAGGVWMFTGRDGMGGGFGADWILIDDFFKNAEEARSSTTRDNAWHCYVSDCKSRLNEEIGGVLMIGTRKHEDDPQGRILNPNNQHYDDGERNSWDVIVLPALAEANDPLGRKPEEPLWPERFSKQFWISMRDNKSELVRMDFQIQGQCNPTPAEGLFFKREWLKTYEPKELPKQLRFYAASDHAVKASQKNDRHCLLMVGIDPAGTVWVLPETSWDRTDTLEMSNRMIELMKSRKPAIWFAAKDQISGSIGPFLRERMKAQRVYQYIKETAETKDLQESRVVSIRNRMAMGEVRFPKQWPLWPQAEKELLTFPNGDHDDLVAALALLGMGMDNLTPAEKLLQSSLPEKGTWGWHTWNQNTGSDPNTKGWA